MRCAELQAGSRFQKPKEASAMNSLYRRKLAAAVAATVVAASPMAHAQIWSYQGVAYSCTKNIQIGPDTSGLLKSFQIDKDDTLAFADCLYACNQTAGCIAVNVKEIGNKGPTICQLFGKVAGVTPYPIQTTSSGETSHAYSCVNVSKTKWTTKDPKGTYQEHPSSPQIPDSPTYQDASRPGAPGTTPGGRR
jgi:hypothetical protein